MKTDHKKFVTKVQSLDPSYKGTIPWQSRGYTRKRSHDQMGTSHDGSHDTKKLCSPLLEKEAEEICHVLMDELNDKSKAYPNLLRLDYSDSDED